MLGLIYDRFSALGKFFSRFRLNKLVHDSCEGRNLGRVLFVGSGGQLEAFCRQFQSESFTTIDIDAARRPDKVMDISRLDIKDTTIDTIFLLEVLEHVQKPQAAIDECFRVLRENGRVILSTPFVFGIHDEPSDFFRYTRYGLMNLFVGKKWRKDFLSERTGFLWTIGVLLSRLSTDNSKTVKLIGLTFIVIFLFVAPIILVIDRILPNTITTGYVAVFSKKL